MSTVLESAPAAAPQPYQQPVVKTGMVVNWYTYSNQRDTPRMGFVDRVYQNSIDVTVIHNGACYAYNGCRHISDPVYRKNPEWGGENGCWDYTPQYEAEQAERQEQARSLEAAKAYCEQLVDELRVRVSDLEVNAQLKAATTKPKDK